MSQAAQLPHAQVTVEKMSPNLIEKVFDRLETRRRLVKIIDLPSRSRKCFHLTVQFFIAILIRDR